MDDHKITRGQFLASVGSIAAVAFLSKFIDSKKAVQTVLSTKATSGYGNSAYGGKKA